MRKLGRMHKAPLSDDKKGHRNDNESRRRPDRRPITEGPAHGPRATTIALAEQIGVSRNTVQARLARLEARGALLPFDRRIDPAFLGYPMRAYVLTLVKQ